MSTNEATLESSDELDAVNEMLSAIGESPVNSLEGDPNADVANCRRILATINRQVQSRGWTFNIEEGATLIPDVFSRTIPYMRDYLKMSSTGGTAYINRQGLVYDRLAKTDEFTGPIQVDLIRLREFSEMPECFRAYILAKASRRFNNRFYGAAEVEASLQEQEAEAWQLLNEYELDYGNYNMLSGDAWVGGKISR